jgi:hypothetical protein
VESKAVKAKDLCALKGLSGGPSLQTFNPVEYIAKV